MQTTITTLLWIIPERSSHCPAPLLTTYALPRVFYEVDS